MLGSSTPFYNHTFSARVPGAALVMHDYSNLILTCSVNPQVTECEIFLSMLVKFLEADKPYWLRTLSLEVLRGLCADATLFRYVRGGYCHIYDRILGVSNLPLLRTFVRP